MGQGASIDGAPGPDPAAGGGTTAEQEEAHRKLEALERRHSTMSQGSANGDDDDDDDDDDESDDEEEESDDSDDDGTYRTELHSAMHDAEVSASVASGTAAQLFELIPWCGHPERPNDENLVVETLRSNEVFVDQRDSYGNTLLIMAAQYRNETICEVLVKEKKARVDCQNQIGTSALHFACSTTAFSLKTCRMLLENGAPVMAVEHEHGMQPIHYAACVADIGLLQLLFEFGAKANAPDNEGYNPVDYAQEAFLSENVAALEEVAAREANEPGNDAAAGSPPAETEKEQRVDELLSMLEHASDSDEDVNDSAHHLTRHRSSIKPLSMLTRSDSSWEENIKSWLEMPTEEDPVKSIAAGNTPASMRSIPEDGASVVVSAMNRTQHNTSRWRQTAWSQGTKKVMKSLKMQNAFKSASYKLTMAKVKYDMALLAARKDANASAASAAEAQIALKAQLSKAQNRITSLSGVEKELEEAHAKNEAHEARIEELEMQVAAGGGGGGGGGGVGSVPDEVVAAKDAKIKAQSQELHDLKDELKALKASKAQVANEKSDLESELEASKAKALLDVEKAQEEGAQRLKALEIANTQQVSALQMQLDNTRADLEKLRIESSDAVTKAQERIDAAVASANAKSQKKLLAIRMNAEATVRRVDNEKQRLYKEYAKEQSRRRALYNELEDLKGKIRVFARFRPLARYEKEKKCQIVCKFPDDYSVKVLHEERGKPVEHTFEFDRVFIPGGPQAEVFDDTKRLMQSACDGYNVCIFAYGQTGSGKTYTMGGVRGDEEKMGISPRAQKRLYEIFARDGDKFDFHITVSMYEIYKNALVDLLYGAQEKLGMVDKSEGAKKKKKKKKGKQKPPSLQVKEDPSKRVVVEGGMVIKVENVDQMNKLFDFGFDHRHVGATKMNAESSRSHLLSMIYIEATNKRNGVCTRGKLTLVDLAGSERAAKTGASGERMKEAKAINQSLSALGNVINALTTASKFVPYRNSLLTSLMKDSLGGNAKTQMFVNCSPADYNSSETISSLNFALRCKKVTNDAQLGVETAQMKHLRKQMEALKSQVLDAGLQPIEIKMPEHKGKKGGLADRAPKGK